MMLLPDRGQRDELDRLVMNYSRHPFGRREFLQRALMLGLTFSSASALLVACGDNTGSSSASDHTVDVLNVWSGEEQASFRAVVEPFTSRTKIAVNLEVTRDLDSALTTSLKGNSPPDIAILPNPGKLQQLASQNNLIRLDTFLDMKQFRKDYARAWIELGSYKGGLYALLFKAANKATVWYNPQQFRALNATIPHTWPELIALSDSIASSNKYPWSMGVASATTTGWPASDWIAEIYLNQFGPDMYDQWVAHKIPWTHKSLKQAFELFGQIVGGKHYIAGAPQTILNTDYREACFAPFSTPPQAYMYYLGDFTAGFITSQFPGAKAGVDFDFFPFPTLNPHYQGAITVGVDMVIAMKDTQAVRELIKYLATAQAQTIWVKRGGFTSLNKSLDLKAYPNAVARASASMLVEADTIKFGAGDLMPPLVQQAFWKGMLAFIEDQKQLDTVLQQIEDAAQQAYTADNTS
ncbi:carbohydrate ABC transporter substrate-binding protein [Ktedonosporobacter rubrisoli]|uniref:Carbohydrate ABC transporter substrate-binding protein n=1 Tax=Ktedonosporobacter rubrisoli TaxID=2509675 RepID=A0A4P6K0E3_KTERU|nr:ABC transporter substrate-binding protein [Ktedonosporobacter rubrisoli]QBD81242.1 carbohydrate ABC transporter substrate-binding protein [Ktedonosporobacter rubrisoli]